MSISHRARRAWMSVCLVPSPIFFFCKLKNIYIHILRTVLQYRLVNNQKLRQRTDISFCYLNLCRKDPYKSHSYFVGFYYHACDSNGLNVFPHQFIFHTAFHTALKKKDITLLTTENHYLRSLCFVVFFMSVGIFVASSFFFLCYSRCCFHFKIRF